MADEFSTPVSSLGVGNSVGTQQTRGGPPPEMSSYEEMLQAQRGDAEETPQKTVRFADPPVQNYSNHADHGYTTSEYATVPPPPHLNHPHPHPPAPYPPGAGGVETEKPQVHTHWFKRYFLQNKTGLIVAAVIFALLYFVVPKLSLMQQFTGMTRLPTWTLATIAVCGGSAVTAASVAI